MSEFDDILFGDHEILWIPGPTEMYPKIRAALARPTIGHRSQACKDLMLRCRDNLAPLFGTTQHVLFESVPATALWEAAIRNLVPKRSLHVHCGAFSERWAKVARACGREADEISVPWGQANRPDTLRAKLAESSYDAVCLIHNETATGVTNPLRELAQVVREQPGTLLLVDAVTSFSGIPIDFDELGIDLAFASAQKCLALPAGFTVYALSDRALERAATAEGRGWLLDFVRAQEGLSKGESVATPSIPHLYALDLQLDRIAAEGLEARYARHEAMATRMRSWASDRGFSMFAEAGFESDTTSCVAAGDLDVAWFVKTLRTRGKFISNGYGKLKGQTFRIGHMGDHGEAQLEELIRDMDACLVHRSPAS
ncbi:MAG: alanine--glyoxylate aminotransferase family protein [Planctomycetes bacterium]|nr:alanine--glyoxylate aminotransferase family protein [Planctomycetota bacterium]